MKTYFRSCLCLSLLLSSAAFMHAKSNDCESSRNRISSVVTQHPHGALLEHQNHYQNTPEYGDECGFNIKFNVTYQFDQTFSEEENITKALFGKAVTNQSGQSCDDDKEARALHIQGTQVNNRSSNALRAEMFGLAPDTDASVHLDPQIQNHLFNFQMYWGLGELLEGLYFQFDLPLVHSKWQLQEGSEDSCNVNRGQAGSNSFVRGCIDAVNEGDISPLNLQQGLRGSRIGDKEQTEWNRIVFKEFDDTEISDLSFSLGYNFLNCPEYHASAYIIAKAPTGTEIGNDQDDKQNLFAPIVGTNHWQLGAGLHGHFELYNWDDANRLTVFMQGYAAHGFDRETTRTFDLNNGQLSRYMLLKEFTRDQNNHLQYNDRLIPAANFTTRCVETDVSVLGEGLIEFMYSNDCGLDVSLGYAIWGRDEEDLECAELPNINLDQSNLGIKGCAPVEALAFTENPNNADQVQTNAQGGANLNGQAITSTQSNADAFSCPAFQQNTLARRNNAQRFRPVDNQPQGFVANGNATDPCVESIAPSDGANISGNQNVNQNLSLVKDSLDQQGNANPKLISKNDIDTNSGLIPSMVSHRIFGRVNYTFEDMDFIPYVGLGASVEFSSSDHIETPERWAIFINGGMSF